MLQHPIASSAFLHESSISIDVPSNRSTTMAGISATQALGSAGTTDASKTASPSKTLDMNAFLRMFTTQLKHQDPTNPLESYELAAQLAQFSSVEKLTDISAKLAEQQQYLVSLTNAQMVQMIGKEVIGAYDGIQLSDGAVSKGYYELPSQAANVTVKIMNESGALIRTLNVGAQNAGRYDVNWNGKDEAGNALPNGTYRFDVVPLAADGTSLDVNEFVTGTAYAFRMEGGVPYLVLGGANGLMLPSATVREVHNPV
jgi:flagellar basal-body rod modification protein FlgD